jgi:hypothetical protein
LAAGESAGYEDPRNRSGAKKVPKDTSHHEDTSYEAAEPWRGLAAITPMQGALGLDATKMEMAWSEDAEFVFSGGNLRCQLSQSES